MAENIVLSLYRNISDELESGFIPAGEPIVISGTGFGTAPDVVLYSDWTDGVISQTAQISDAIIGSWDSGSYATALLPKYYELSGRVGITNREGGVNATTNNRLTGFVKQFPSHTDYFVAYDMGVPSGRTFSGSSTESTLPAISSLKFCWKSHNALDTPEDVDIVCHSWNGSSFVTGGNQAVTEIGGTPTDLYLNSTFDFNAWNYFSIYQKAGTPNPNLNSGVSLVTKSNSTGTIKKNRTSLPIYKQRVTLTPTVQDNTLYRVTINGVNHDYTSGTGQTVSQIGSQIISAINAGEQPVSTSQAGSKIFIDADVATEFTCSVSSNLSKVDSISNYTHTSFPAWSGNGSQDLCLHVSSYFYEAHGNNCDSRIVFTDTLNPDNATIYVVVPPQNWTNTTVSCNPKQWIRDITNYVHIIIGNTVIQTKAI
jgi:hypothetical protein